MIFKTAGNPERIQFQIFGNLNRKIKAISGSVDKRGKSGQGEYNRTRINQKRGLNNTLVLSKPFLIELRI